MSYLKVVTGSFISINIEMQEMEVRAALENCKTARDLCNVETTPELIDVLVPLQAELESLNKELDEYIKRTDFGSGGAGLMTDRERAVRAINENILDLARAIWNFLRYLPKKGGRKYLAEDAASGPVAGLKEFFRLRITNIKQNLLLSQL